MSIYITGTGLFTPPHSISNDELVESFNAYVEKYNRENAEAIASGEIEALEASDADFITKVSGIKSRYVMDKDGILDPNVMTPCLPARTLGETPSLMAQMGMDALNEALSEAGLQADD